MNNIVMSLQQSKIREISKHCVSGVDINLGQGICDLPTNVEIRNKTCEAINNNLNMYSASEGIIDLRCAVRNKLVNFNNIPLNEVAHDVLITNGATGAFICSVITLFNPGDEIILFEPFYGCHRNILEFYQLKVKTVKINLADFSIDFNELAQQISSKVRGIVICNPCNPCGKVFSTEELNTIGKLAQKNGLWVISDEIYEYITYPAQRHVSFSSIKDYAENSVTISGFSKTYNVTGWRLGYVAANKKIIEKMSIVQDLLYVCPATPLQYGMLQALSLPLDYYEALQTYYLLNRNIVVDTLKSIGATVPVPQGAYYAFADFSEVLAHTTIENLSSHLLNEAHVATIPGETFYVNPEDGHLKMRICYATNTANLQVAMDNLKKYFL